MRILITGGAGFVGSRLALAFREAGPQDEIVALDNLRRRGSELNIPLFKKNQIEFVHGDIRSADDLNDLKGNFDVFVEASAEPSVLAGLSGSPAYVLQTNLTGTLNCLELARKRAGMMVFLSTSRVYSIQPLRELALREGSTRLELKADQKFSGASEKGVAENFPTHLPRSIYGATKLASELVIQEYADTYGMKAVINRCGVIAGPGQFGKVDQGVFTLWVANHYFGKPLKYTGFGGQGKQVRDLLHPLDLFDLIQTQIRQIQSLGAAEVYNVGGGTEVSTSLCELTAICQQVTGRKIEIASDTQTTSVDIPLYISDNTKVSQALGWKPKKSIKDIVENIHQWIRQNEVDLRPIFGGES